MKPSPFELERFFAQYEFSVKYLLCSSDCESVSIADLLTLEPDAQEKFHKVWLGYTESPGSPGLRKEISQIYASIQPDEILVHTGAEEAIFLFMHAVLQPGDHVIVHSPCYQSLTEVAHSIGCQVSPWLAREGNGWALDMDELVSMFRPNTRLVVVNTPHNPTGFLMKSSDYLMLNELVSQRDILLFSDEVYRESEYDPKDRLPSACDINPSAISLGVMSKTYGLAGLRIGWVATHNQPILQKMAELKDYTTICNSAPAEFLSELALRHRKTLAERNLNIIRENLDLLDAFFRRQAAHLSWVKPKAGSIAFPKLEHGDIDQFCDHLVNETGVLLLPGTLFNDTGNHFRLGFGRRNLPDALPVLENFVNQ
jgi:aspartate/methionine/tyrosine aminotransferase